MRFDLQYPPSVNTLYNTGFDKKRHLSEKGRAYKKNVYADVLEQHGIFKPFEGRLRLTLEVWVPDKRKRDLDNTIKIVADSLQYANVFMDDEQITEIHAYKRGEAMGGKCIVEIEELKEEL